MRFLVGCAVLAALVCATALAGETTEPPREEAAAIELTQALALPRWGGFGRSPLGRDAIIWHMARGTWQRPTEGLVIATPDGEERTWEPLAAGPDGWLQGPAMAGGYAYFEVELPEDRVLILRAQGHSGVWVNGEPHTGDPYAMFELRAPVALRRGTNEILFQGARGRLHASLHEPARAVSLSDHDALLPDLIVGERADAWASVMLTNATHDTLSGLAIETTVGDEAPVRTSLPAIGPVCFREVGVRLEAPAPTAEGEAELTVRLMRGTEELDRLALPLRVVAPTSVHSRTFISEVDGSVQYYGVQPAKPAPGRTRPCALVLTLHGAGVEARGQAAAYSPKTWANIVAPTNRRPYGFDWEDWGRLDAIEVLAEAKRRYDYDPERVYLTGHSMGGHGAWHVGLTFPDLFGAVGPSAGWVSFASYGGGPAGEPASPLAALLARARTPSDTLALVRNAALHGVYILHGADDDNVPAAQAHAMDAALAEFHRDYVFHEEPGMGHWWDLSDEPGADCVDWPPLFDFFARHARPAADALRRVTFTTASPGVSADCAWARIECQTVPLAPSSVDIRWDPWTRRFSGSTENVSRLSLSLAHVHPGEPISVRLDDASLDAIRWPTEGRLWLSRDTDAWEVTAPPDPSLKGPARYGVFKDAFRNRMLLVYATGGSDEERRLSYAKARYDAEGFWYRGNGAVDIIADTDFDPAAEPDRNVILYGNAATNAAWSALLGDSPLQVRPGRVKWRDRVLEGDGLVCLFIRPRPGSDTASVGAVAVTGAAGYPASDLARYFVSGAAYPDYLVFDVERDAPGSGGALLAGFFGPDWSIDSGEHAWANGL